MQHPLTCWGRAPEFRAPLSKPRIQASEFLSVRGMQPAALSWLHLSVAVCTRHRKNLWDHHLLTGCPGEGWTRDSSVYRSCLELWDVTLGCQWAKKRQNRRQRWEPWTPFWDWVSVCSLGKSFCFLSAAIADDSHHVYWSFIILKVLYKRWRALEMHFPSLNWQEQINMHKDG